MEVMGGGVFEIWFCKWLCVRAAVDLLMLAYMRVPMSASVSVCISQIASAAYNLCNQRVKAESCDYRPHT